MAFRPELRIQVLPVDAETAIPQPFVIYDLPAPHRRVVYLEGVGDAMRTDVVELVARYSIAYESLQAAAMSPASSLAYVNGRLADLWNPDADQTSWRVGASPATPETPDVWKWLPEERV